MFQPSDHRARRNAWLLLALSGLLCPFLLYRWLLGSGGISDFNAFRSFAMYVSQHPAAGIYQPVNLMPYQHGLHGIVLPYLYHPGMLLLVRWMSWLPPIPGRVVWSAASVLVYVLALCVGQLGGRTLLAAAAVVAPSTLITVAMGQNTLIIAAILIAALRARASRPLLAGVLFGVATLKPQFGLLVPVLLLARGEFRTIAVAAATTCAVGLLSVAVFGTDVWRAWLDAQSTIAQILPRHYDPHLVNMPTIEAMSMQLGAGFRTACWIQGLASLTMIAAVWRVSRDRAVEGEPLAAFILAGCLLATPYAYFYDLPLLTGAVLLLIRHRAANGGEFAPFEMPLFIACLSLPFFRMDGVVMPVAPVLIALLTIRAAMVARPRRASALRTGIVRADCLGAA